MNNGVNPPMIYNKLDNKQWETFHPTMLTQRAFRDTLNK